MLRLYDTLSRSKRLFSPLRGRTARIYTCGPSVYNYSHIGNFRTYLFEDVLVRYLGYRGYKVKRVMNITDIEDKAIEAAKKGGVSLARLENDKVRAFFRDFDALGMRRPDVVAKASAHVPAMVRLIGRLCARGYCRLEGDGVYFDIRRFRPYGRLKRMRNRRYRGMVRVDDYAWDGLRDFRLWKAWTRADGPVRWASPFGDGRPGWHIECSAMAMEYLGERFDIHCGGTDNIFPHHENEIAQCQAATGKQPANFWLHARHLTIGKRKMSKRTGNVLYVRGLLEGGAHAECLRFYLLSEGYRKRLDFTMGRFRSKVCACERTGGLLRKLGRLRRHGDGRLGRGLAAKLQERFERAMDDDLNTGRAFRAIFAIFAEIDELMAQKRLSGSDAKHILTSMRRIDSVLGVFFTGLSPGA